MDGYPTIPENGGGKTTSCNLFIQDSVFLNAETNFVIPDNLRDFFRRKSNRRAGKLFLVFTPIDDSVQFRHLTEIGSLEIVKSISVFQADQKMYCTMLIMHTEYRKIDLKKILKRYSLDSSKLFYAVHLFQLFEKCTSLYGQPVFQRGVKIERETRVEDNFDHERLVNFALSHECTVVYTLMVEYAHLAYPCDRFEITKDHEEDHDTESRNAKLFLKLPDRQKACSNAIECVIASTYHRLSNLTNTEWLENRSQEFRERLSQVDDARVFGEAFYYWKYCLGQPLFFDIMSFILSVFTNREIPQMREVDKKKRYLCLLGPYNCGKTTLASAICRFFEGASININIGKGRLPFHLGAAIGKRFVLFDDVKGYKTKIENLLTGSGIKNLDDLREHLDGKIEVQLKRKRCNPVLQRFPQGILTMNEYEIPDTLKLRLKIINLPLNPLYDKHQFNVNMDTIYIAMVMANLIPCDENFRSHVSLLTDKWISEHLQDCKCFLEFETDSYILP